MGTGSNRPQPPTEGTGNETGTETTAEAGLGSDPQQDLAELSGVFHSLVGLPGLLQGKDPVNRRAQRPAPSRAGPGRRTPAGLAMVEPITVTCFQKIRLTSICPGRLPG